MKDRIAHIMRAKNLKATDFAALLGIQPSGVSHILAGRNNPSLEFVKRIKETFPEYNLDWIICGTGPMTTSESFKTAFNETPSQEVVSPAPPREPATLFDDVLPPEAAEEPLSLQENPPLSSDRVTESLASDGVKRLVVLYEDGTFEQYRPR